MTGEDNPDERVKEVAEILDRLEKFWLEHPYLRLGQIVNNGTTFAHSASTFYIEDGPLLDAIEQAHRPPERPALNL